MPLPAAACEAVSATSSSAVRPQGSSGVGWRARDSGRLGGGSAGGVPPAAAAAAAVKAHQAGWSSRSGEASCRAAVVARIWQSCWLAGWQRRWPRQAECIGRRCKPCRGVPGLQMRGIERQRKGRAAWPSATGWFRTSVQSCRDVLEACLHSFNSTYLSGKRAEKPDGTWATAAATAAPGKRHPSAHHCEALQRGKQ